jgi:hypothetical protein
MMVLLNLMDVDCNCAMVFVFDQFFFGVLPATGCPGKPQGESSIQSASRMVALMATSFRARQAQGAVAKWH